MAKTKKQYINLIKRQLKNLGTYEKEFDEIIFIYAGLLAQYNQFELQFEESGYQIEEEYTNKAGATNMRKVPLYSAMESLRKDIVTYSDRLGLNVKAMEGITVERKSTSKLELVLGALNE
ncbi:MULTISPECIES: P27 family phage terminase small subunit [Helcococcus]|uniref:P27 family phage terminase small subunit n=1 Tax=Helcococcus bovis TaxID=3153252 RepID=A0ABW9F749_9FIRM